MDGNGRDGLVGELLAAEGPSVDLWHHEVEQDQSDRVPRRTYVRQCVGAVGGGRYIEALSAQKIGDGITDISFVVDDEDS